MEHGDTEIDTIRYVARRIYALNRSARAIPAFWAGTCPGPGPGRIGLAAME